MCPGFWVLLSHESFIHLFATFDKLEGGNILMDNDTSWGNCLCLGRKLDSDQTWRDGIVAEEQDLEGD